MAKVHIVLSRLGAVAAFGSPSPVPDAAPRLAQTIDTTAANQVSTLVAEDDDFWELTVSGGDVMIAFADDPVAGPNVGRMVTAGSSVGYAATAGQKVAVRDVA